MRPRQAGWSAVCDSRTLCFRRTARLRSAGSPMTCWRRQPTLPTAATKRTHPNGTGNLTNPQIFGKARQSKHGRNRTPQKLGADAASTGPMATGLGSKQSEALVRLCTRPVNTGACDPATAVVVAAAASPRAREIRAPVVARPGVIPRAHLWLSRGSARLWVHLQGECGNRKLTHIRNQLCLTLWRTNDIRPTLTSGHVRIL